MCIVRQDKQLVFYMARCLHLVKILRKLSTDRKDLAYVRGGSGTSSDGELWRTTQWEDFGQRSGQAERLA